MVRRYVAFDDDYFTYIPLAAVNDADHSRARRLLAHAFSDNALRGQEDILTHYFNLLVSKLRQQIDSPNEGKVDMVAWYNFTTFDIIGDLTFGESFHALENGDYHPWIRNIFRSVKAGILLILGPRYPILRVLLQIMVQVFPSIRKARNTHFEYTQLQAEKRLATKTDRKDFMTYVSTSRWSN